MRCHPRPLGALVLLLTLPALPGSAGAQARNPEVPGPKPTPVGAGPAVAQDRIEGDRYQNPRYGVQIEKPPRWHFITATTVMEIARKAAGMAPPTADVGPVKAAGVA